MAASDVPGEWTAPTQPFPTKPAPFERQGVFEDYLFDLTPELEAEALEILSKFRYGPLYTPPSVATEEGTKGTLAMPGSLGGANWPGASVDPETGILYVTSAAEISILALAPPDPERSSMDFVRMSRLPGLDLEGAGGPRGLPLIKPPWGQITAIDLNRGEHLWMTPNGPGPTDHPALAGMDLPWLGQRGRPAPLLTRTLLFLGEGSTAALSILPIAGGDAFRAYHKETGEPLWELGLEAGTSGAPMTYMADGKQYIVVAIGDRETRGQLVALALP